MIIKTCIGCRYHLVKDNEDTQRSYCRKEALWSIYTKCIKQTALDILISAGSSKSEHEEIRPQEVNS